MAKRTIPRAIFQPLEGLKASDLKDNELLFKLVKKETYPAIQEAFEGRKTFATLFEVNTSGQYIDIPKQYWVNALEECIKFNLVDEKFEECLKIKKLIDDIKAPTKPLKKLADGKGANRDSSSNKLTT